MYSLLFWGFILPIFAFPVAGIALIPALGYAMIAFAAWRLGAYSPPFRVVAAAALILTVLVLPTPYLPKIVYTSGAFGITSLLVQCLLGWSVLSCVARDCETHGHIDVAAAARWRRIAYVVIMIAVPAVVMCLPARFVDTASPSLLLLPVATLLVAYVLLVWTVQTAKIRLFP